MLGVVLAFLASLITALLLTTSEVELTTSTEVETPCGGFCGWSTGGACVTDFDCVRDGCSGQVCRSTHEEPVFTTCEWRECYDAQKYGVRCKCIDGKCKWG